MAPSTTPRLSCCRRPSRRRAPCSRCRRARESRSDGCGTAMSPSTCGQMTAHSPTAPSVAGESRAPTPKSAVRRCISPTTRGTMRCGPWHPPFACSYAPAPASNRSCKRSALFPARRIPSSVSHWSECPRTPTRPKPRSVRRNTQACTRPTFDSKVCGSARCRPIARCRCGEAQLAIRVPPKCLPCAPGCAPISMSSSTACTWPATARRRRPFRSTTGARLRRAPRASPSPWRRIAVSPMSWPAPA